MSGLTNALVAQQVQALLDTQKRQTDYLTAWLGGSPDGGPNNDGRYPFVDLAGVDGCAASGFSQDALIVRAVGMTLRQIARQFGGGLCRDC